jgi:toxin-antitoxin system PIN domain toxin
VIAIDTNLLVYAHRSEMPFHDHAARLLRQLCEGAARWVLPWSCAHEFLAVVTHPRIYKTPTPMEQALAQLSAWLDSPSCLQAAEQPDHFERLRELVERGSASGPKVHDARIAAVCLSAGVTELWSADRDFSRFPALRSKNPLLDPR